MSHPKWKVVDPAGNYQASCHEVEAALSLAEFYGPGSFIAWATFLRSRACYTVPANGSIESIDIAAEEAIRMREQRWQESEDRQQARCKHWPSATDSNKCSLCGKVGIAGEEAA